jgi:hypothetical protein
MHDASHAWFTVMVFISLFGLVHAVGVWDPDSPVRTWNSCSKATQRNFVLLCFLTCFIAIFVFFALWIALKNPTYQQRFFRLLLGTSWLNGLTIGVCTNLFWKTTTNGNLGHLHLETVVRYPCILSLRRSYHSCTPWIGLCWRLCRLVLPQRYREIRYLGRRCFIPHVCSLRNCISLAISNY